VVARKSDPEASRAAILAAARRCFSAKGFAGTSMNDIARAAEVTQSLIHHHFGAKAPLWRQVLADAFEEYRVKQNAQLSAQGHPRGLIHGSMADYFHFLAAHPDMLRLMAWAQLQGSDELTEIVSELYREGVSRLQAAQQAGIVRRDVPAEHILTVFLGLARTWFEERNLVVDEQDAAATAKAGEDYLDAAWALFANGVVAPAHCTTADSAP